MDAFHVVEWAMTALAEIRKDIWHDAYSEYKQVKKANPRSKGRPKKDDPELASMICRICSKIIPDLRSWKLR